jgi:uncharacterized protein YeaO (DUF488 family)
MLLQIKRAYEPPEPEDGEPFLIDRLWPRGLKKDSLRLTGWAKEVAPRTDLRRWFGHDPSRWPEFRRRYFAELDQKPHAWQPLLGAASRGSITLLYSARDREHNDAVALKDYLENKRRGAPDYR